MGTMAASTLCRPGEGRGPGWHLVKANKIRPIRCVIKHFPQEIL